MNREEIDWNEQARLVKANKEWSDEEKEKKLAQIEGLAPENYRWKK